MKFGYARVSTQDQNLEIQTNELEKYGCERIYMEKRSAVKERPELESLLQVIREGDAVVVWKLDRLGRSLKHLVNLVTLFQEKSIEFISISDNIDTTTIQGRLIFNIFASFAEFERELISERTKKGLEAARLKGHYAGRKPGLSPEAKKIAKNMLTLSRDTTWSVDEICNALKRSKATYYRYIEWAGIEEEASQLKKKQKQLIK